MPLSNQNETTCKFLRNDDPIVDAVKDLYLSRKYTDVTITAGSEAFNVNRSIVCLRSPVLAKECDGAFEEAQGTINTTHDPNALKAFIEYLYIGSYESMPALDAKQSDPSTLTGGEAYKSSNSTRCSALETRSYQSSAPAILHAKVYALADYYDVPDLKSCIAGFFECVTSNIAPETFAFVVEEVYQSTPAHDRLLRDIVIATAVRRSMVLRDEIDYEHLADFATDYTKALAEHAEGLNQALEDEYRKLSAAEMARLVSVGQNQELQAQCTKLSANLADVQEQLDRGATLKCRSCYTTIECRLTSSPREPMLMELVFKCSHKPMIDTCADTLEMWDRFS